VSKGKIVGGGRRAVVDGDGDVLPRRPRKPGKAKVGGNGKQTKVRLSK